VATPSPPPAFDGIDLSDSDFWAQSLAHRHAAFARLRSLDQPPYFADPETPFAAPGGGYYALVRHADVAEASRHPEVFCSGRGATSIVDLPVEFNEYFGSMINMDPHFCLGAHLARREITAILRELLHRVPGIRAAAPPDRLLSAFINGIKHLPREFTS
jgi:cytochrome P450